MLFRNFFLLLILLVWGMSALSMGTGFQVQNAFTSLVNGVYLLQARLDLNLSSETLQALKSGVPLTIVCKINVERQRRYFLWNESIMALEQRYRLVFHSLTEQYRVTNLNTDVRETYFDLDQALHAIGKLDDFPLLDQRLLNNQESYKVRLRVYLDIESLPSPLRIVAYVSSSWRLVSQWYSWPLLIPTSP